MLQVTEVRVDVTRQGPKQFESDKVGLTATLAEGANVTEAIAELKRVILGEISKEVSGTPAKVETKVAKKEEAPKVEAPKIENAVQGEPEVSKVEAPKKTKKAAAPKATKNTPYDRQLDTHKSLLGKYLDETVPGWKKQKIQQASKASNELAGSDFLDAEGNILQSFKDAFLAYLRD